MKATSKFLFIVLLLSMMVVFPGTVLAKTDQYGYDAQHRMFKGTLENWEAFLKGSPPTPFDWKQTDTTFIIRKWSKTFDPMIQGNPPSAPGAWQKVEVWEYLSGDQLGWTWHEEIEIVYSPRRAIPGAVELPPEEMMFSGFYLVQDREWLVGPNGEITVDQNFSARHPILKKLILKFAKRFSH